METGLALGGGGARGAFQIGAWQAFRELGLQFDWICGTSIGAINGALMAGGDFERALYMWQHLQMEQCLQFSGQKTVRSDDLLSPRNFRILTREIIAHRSLNTQPLRELLTDYVDEPAVRNSHSRFGLLTAAMPDMQPRPYWIDEIPSGLLVDYIMASSRLPMLTPIEIDGHRMIDGGVVETLPLGMLRNLGIRKIVAVNLDSKVALSNPAMDNIQLTHIHDRQSLGHVLDITPETVERNRRLGYLDTLKAFGHLHGEFFSFDPFAFQMLRQRFGRHLAGLEQAALAYGLDRLVLYDGDTFLDEIQNKRREIQAIYAKKRQALQIDHKIRAVASGQLKVLSLLPPMQLSFLLELTAIHKAAGTLSRIPSRYFKNLDQAVQAMEAFDEQPG